MTIPKYQGLTAILVHAAWADASSWNKVTVSLRKLGLRVRAAQNPLTSLSDDVAALKGLLRKVEGPVLLVAHSYAGAVITAAGADNPEVKALVYIAAIAPDEGETVGAWFQRVPSRNQIHGRNSLPTRRGFFGCRRVRSQTR